MPRSNATATFSASPQTCIFLKRPLNNFSGAHTSGAAGQPPRRAAPTEPGRAGPRTGRGRGQAGERGTRGTAGILQGEHELGENVHGAIFPQLSDIYLITVIIAADQRNVTGLQDDLKCKNLCF